jgi:hypothetical protein
MLRAISRRLGGHLAESLAAAGLIDTGDPCFIDVGPGHNPVTNRSWPTPTNSGDLRMSALKGWSGNAGKSTQPMLMTQSARRDLSD